MGDVLVYMEASGDFERLLSWARPLTEIVGGDLLGVVATAEPLPEEPTAADVVLEVVHRALSTYLPEAHLSVLVAAIEARNPDLVLIENTTAGYDLAAAVAAVSGLPFVGYCVEVSPNDRQAECASAIYGGQLLARIRTSLPAVLAVNSSALHEQSQTSGRGERVALTAPAELDRLRTTFIEAVVPPDEGVDLTKAERIVCVGRGIGAADNVPLAEDLASALDAELAGSRPVVDSGWLPKVRQVGKSGARVKPKLYLSLGVSGAPEHIEGMQSSELIVAVNTDPSAAIFNVAHYGAVADLFDVADELTALLG